MNNFAEIIIPSFIILIANLFSHEYASPRYEMITVIFGWLSIIAIVIWLFVLALSAIFTMPHVNTDISLIIRRYALQVFALSLVTAISRDYEKILKPNAIYIEEKIKKIYALLIKRIGR